MPDRVEPPLRQFGNAPVRVAHGLLHFLQRFLRHDMLGGRQPHIGEFTVQDELNRSSLVARKVAGQLGLRRAAFCGSTERCLRPAGAGLAGNAGLAGLLLEKELKHSCAMNGSKPPS